MGVTRMGEPCCQGGIVSSDGLSAREDRVMAISKRVDVGARRGARDPLALAGCRRDASVEAGRELYGDAWPPSEHPAPKTGDEALAVALEDRANDLHAGAAEPGESSTGDDGVGIDHTVDDLGDPGREQRFRARPGTPGVVTRLEGNDGGPTGDSPSRLRERMNLGVRSARTSMMTDGDELTLSVEDDAPYGGVRRRAPERDGSGVEGEPHGTLDVHGPQPSPMGGGVTGVSPRNSWTSRANWPTSVKLRYTLAKRT